MNKQRNFILLCASLFAATLLIAALPVTLNTGQFNSYGPLSLTNNGHLGTNKTIGTSLAVTNPGTLAVLRLAVDGTARTHIESKSNNVVQWLLLQGQGAMSWSYLNTNIMSSDGLNVRIREPIATNDAATKFYTTNYAANFIPTNIASAKGDVAVYNGTAWTKISPSGTNSNVLTELSSAATGLKFLPQSGGGGSSSISTENVLYVAKNGDDVTGTRNRLDLPFLTIGQAKTNSHSDDLIYVFPGTYDQTDLATNANYYFCAGANVIYTGTSTRAIFDDYAGPINIQISGYGSFSNTSANAFSAITITNPASRVVAQGNIIAVTQFGAQSALYVSNCAYSDFRFQIYDGGVVGASGVIWKQGETHLHGGKLLGANYGLWAIDPDGVTAANIYSDADYYNGSGGAVAVSSTNQTYRVWITKASEMVSTDTDTILFGGRTYIEVEKINCSSGSAAVSDLLGSGQLWLSAQKISSPVPFFKIANGSKITAFVLDYEDTGITSEGIDMGDGTGELNLSGGTMTLLNTGAVGLLTTTGSAVRLRNMVIDTAATGGAPIVVSGTTGPTILQNCVLVSSNTINCIETPDSATVLNYYSVANHTTNGSVTVNVTPLTVNTAVK